MNCPVCGQDKPLLVLVKKETLCSDCYLGQISSCPDESLRQDHAQALIAKDPAGRQHSFLLSHDLAASQKKWLAEEKAGYSFAVRVKQEESPIQALARLFQKIIAGLQQKNLLADEADLDLSARDHYLAAIGSGRIDYDAGKSRSRLALDGQLLTAEDFFTLLSTYSGHKLVFQIQDMTDDILEKGMALLACRIDARSIQDHFSKCLSWFLDGSFLSYKREAALASALERPLAEFALFCRYRSQQEAEDLGQLLSEYLASFQTDAQHFPQAQIKQIFALLADQAK